MFDVPGSGNLDDSSLVSCVNLGQLAFLKFHRFLSRPEIATFTSLVTKIGQWPDLGNLGRTILEQRGMMSLVTVDKSGQVQVPWQLE